jgi:L-threonylcarbamoyladenylate synthase
MAQLRELISEDPPALEALARAFSPGPLTFVMRKAKIVPTWVVSEGDTVALRIPDHPVTLDLLKAFGRALAVTSANRSGEPSTTTAEEVLASIGGGIAGILDGGRAPGGVASTIIDLTVSPPRLLREGPLTKQDLRAVWPEID